MSSDTMTDAGAQAVDRAAFLVAPLNEASRARLAENGLEARLVSSGRRGAVRELAAGGRPRLPRRRAIG